MKTLFILLVTTFSGDLYVAGSGSDCANAWDHAVIEENWREISCIEVQP